MVPGDMVSFLVPRRRGAGPRRPPSRDADSGAAAQGDTVNPTPRPPRVPGSVRERSGPSRSFRWGIGWAARKSCGRRRSPQVQENVMGISVGLKPNGQLQDDAQTFWDLLMATISARGGHAARTEGRPTE